MLSLSRLLLLAIALCGIAPAQAECSCIWRGPFTRVQADTDLVVSATVIASRGNSVDLRVDRLLRGTHHQESVRIWLDTGDLCRAEINTFDQGSQWIMALDRIDQQIPGGFNPNTPNISYGRVGDYSLSRCGGYWLRQTENLVSGNLSGGARWEMQPQMSPVLIDLVASFVAGDIDEATLQEAGEVDPALQELMLQTRLHLRRQY